MNAFKNRNLVLYCLQERFYRKTCNIGKRAVMLSKYINHNNDKKKNWHLTFMSKPPKNENIFEKTHKPSKRVTVLNALFVRNITDVLSTGDVAPEILGYGIEITGIKVTSDFQIVNVFWQAPINKNENSLSVNIQNILSARAPKIRAELISRNILGRVPKIFFVQDKTNVKAAEFEKALLSADLGTEDEKNIISDQKEFLDKIFTFTSAQNKKKTSEDRTNLSNPTEIKSPLVAPENPIDMKSNILGLNHDTLLTRVVVAKRKAKPESVDILFATNQQQQKPDLLSQIPGTALHPNDDREKILKRFYIERKMLMKERKKSMKHIESDCEVFSGQMIANSQHDPDYEPDYYEEETINNDAKNLWDNGDNK